MKSHNYLLNCCIPWHKQAFIVCELLLLEANTITIGGLVISKLTFAVYCCYTVDTLSLPFNLLPIFVYWLQDFEIFLGEQTRHSCLQDSGSFIFEVLPESKIRSCS